LSELFGINSAQAANGPSMMGGPNGAHAVNTSVDSNPAAVTFANQSFSNGNPDPDPTSGVLNGQMVANALAGPANAIGGFMGGGAYGAFGPSASDMSALGAIASSVFGDSGAALNKGDAASAVGMNLAGGVSPAAGFGVATYAGPDMGSTAGVPAETPGITGTGQSSSDAEPAGPNTFGGSALNDGHDTVSIDSGPDPLAGPMSVAVGGIPSNMAVNSGDKNAIDMAADRENAPATSGGGRTATIEQAVTSGPSPPDFGLHGPTEHFGGGQTSSGQNGFGDFGSGLSSLGGNGMEAAALNSIYDAHEVAKSDGSNPVTQKVLGPWAAFSPFKDNPFWLFNF
jgi:hypothetical protein